MRTSQAFALAHQGQPNSAKLTGSAPSYTMKFQLDEPQGGNSISRHDGQNVWVNGVQHRQSVLVPWQGEATRWDVDRLDALQEAHFEHILDFKPELVIFGSGARLRFVPPRLYRSLMDARIGLETMDIGAACRTYNVLASEGRSVLAALLLEI